MVNSYVLLSDNDPLLRIGQVQILFYIKALSDGMVIDFLMFTSRPSPMEWSLIFFLHIKALSNGMVIDFCHIKALSDGMVIDFLMFTSRLMWPQQAQAQVHQQAQTHIKAQSLEAWWERFTWASHKMIKSIMGFLHSHGLKKSLKYEIMHEGSSIDLNWAIV